jgi:predicted acylesterase/phospholipase RssA
LFAKSSGVLKGDALQAYVNRMVHQTPIEKLKKPFGAVATDLSSWASRFISAREYWHGGARIVCGARGVSTSTHQ